MKLYSYIVTHDDGFAPNPFGGYLTLATCKPQIRRTAAVGDWLMGTGPKNGIGSTKLIYIAKISEVISVTEYGFLEKYKIKRPNSCGEKWSKRGDNIYFINLNGKWEQRKNPFHDFNDMGHDTGGKNVLICKDFWYFGSNALDIPIQYHNLIKSGPNCRANEGNPEVASFIKWIKSNPHGIIGSPTSMAH